MSKHQGYVHSIETFGSVDGPGVRYVIFLQGCAMRCQFCHNPDTWNLISQKVVNAEDLLKQALRYRSYWSHEGGITISGGEPLLQMDFLLEFCTLAKKEGIHVTVDTGGQPFTKKDSFLSKFKQLLAVVDLFLLDIKHIDDAAHQKLTGCTNQNILEMAKFLSENNQPVWIRHVLVPSINSNDAWLLQLNAFLSTLENVEKVEILPYHTLGVYKWMNLGIPYKLNGIDPPDKQMLDHANQLLNTSSYPKKR